MRFSVVVPAFNAEKTVKECIHSLLQQEFKDTEIIIVNDASTDNTQSILEEFKNKIKIIQNKKNLGAAESRNIAATKAQGEFIAFTDSDCIADRAWLKSAEMELREKKTDVLQGRVKTDSKGIFYHFNELLGFSGNFISSNLFVRKELFQRAKGFDQAFDSFREDTDLVVRLKEIGASIGFSEKIKVFHPAKKRSFLDLVRFQKKYKSDVLLAKKHPKEFKEINKPIYSSPLFRYRLVNGFIAASAAMFFFSAALLPWFFLACYALSVFLGLHLALREKAPAASRFALVFLNFLVAGATFYWFWAGAIKFKKIIV